MKRDGGGHARRLPVSWLHISSNGGNFVARCNDDEGIALVSCDVERITEAIDQLWDGLEGGNMPPWFRDPTIDLDDPAYGRHFTDAAKEPAPITQQPRNQITGQVMFSLAVVAIAAPIAMFMRCQLAECEPDIVFTLAVCAAAMVGTLPALLLTGLSAVVYNFTVVPPVGTFTSPTGEEIVYVLINLLASITIPMFLEWVTRAKADRSRIRGI